MTTPAITPGAHVHLVGIGGVGMSALAQLLLERGHPVSGSDLRGGRTTVGLEAMGARIHVGHDAAHLADADVVAISTAIPERNPELAAARQRGLPVLRRAELLAALIEGQRGLLIAGTHGKTTTTAMVTVALQAAGHDPSFAIGGRLHEAGTSAHHGSGDVFVAEADESDSSFLVFTPDCAVVTNVELDHHDHFAGVEAVDEVFRGFLAHRTAGAPAIVCLDDPGVRRLLDDIAEPVVTYGRDDAADLRILDEAYGREGSAFTLRIDGEELGPVSLRLPGPHNVANAAAALGAARWAGADLAAAAEGLARYGGTQRRFQRLGEAAGITVVDDYAHHPTELRATLTAARQHHPGGRVVAVFQPHRYSRTAALGEALGEALAAADLAIVADVYGAGETPVAGVTGGLVADAAAARGGTARFVSAGESLLEVVVEAVERGDLVLTLGAGDITELGPQLLRRFGGGG